MPPGAAPLNWLMYRAVVEALFGHQLVVRGHLDDLAAVDHHDPGGVADGGQPVGDGEAGLALHQLPQALLDQLLGAGIHVAGGLVQDHDLGIGHHGPGNGDHLALSLAQVGPALGQHACRNPGAGS